MAGFYLRPAGRLGGLSLFPVVLLLAASASITKAAAIYQVTVNTASISGTTGNINFQFNPGGASQSAFVQISGFSSVGGTLSGVPSTIGGASGSLPGMVTIANSGALNDYFHSFTFGTSFQFLLTIDGPAIQSPNGTATSGSSFGIALYDQAGVNPLLTTDPNGFAGIANVQLNGTVTTTAFPAAQGSPSAVSFDVAPAIPEPAPYITLSCSLILIGIGAAMRRRQGSRRQ